MLGRSRNLTLGVALATLGAGCSEKGTERAARERPERPARPDRVFASFPVQPPTGLEAQLERIDPAHLGWSTEVVATRAEEALRAGLAAVLRGSDDALDADLGLEFEGATALVPRELEVVFDDGALRVRRAKAPAGAASCSRDAFGGLVRDLARPFRECAETRAEVWITDVAARGGPDFDARARVRLAGLGDAGRTQVNALWRLVLRPRPRADRVALRRIELEQYEEAFFARPPFDELTRHVFAAQPFLADELHAGALELYRRTDRSAVDVLVMMGMHGMAVGDVDGDGLEDLYLAHHAGQPNRLFLHQPDGTVRESAAAAGVDFLDDSTGVLVVDLDGDGWREICVGTGTDVVIAWNDGSGRFPRTSLLRCPGLTRVYSLAAADPDSDGDLDLYATRYLGGELNQGYPTPYHDANNGAPNVYWRNDGEAGFTDATAAVGLDENNRRFSLAAIWEDFDDDGDLDLYVANDFGRNNLYANDGGLFRDVALEAGAVDMAAGMGLTCADVELDGDVDLYVSNMFSPAGMRVTTQPRWTVDGYATHTRGNTLLMNRGGGRFEDASESSGSAPGGWAWGAMFVDFDNDALADLFVPNGFLTGRKERDLAGFFWHAVVSTSPAVGEVADPYRAGWATIEYLTQNHDFSWNGRERNVALWNLGGGTFADVSAAAGLDHMDDGRVACVVDWDGDGRLDLWLRNRTAPIARFLRNVHAAPSGWIAFELVGRGANRDAIGALVRVEAGGRSQRRRVYAGEGYLGGSTHRLHFGVGAARGVERVTIRWPDGSEEVLGELAAGRLYRVEQGTGAARALELPRRSPLEAARAERVSERIGERATRVPLLERLPLTRLELPRFDARPAPVSGFAGRPLLVVLWASWDERGPEPLGELGRLARRAGFALHPLTVDRLRDLAHARSELARVGLKGAGGALDEGTQRSIEIAVAEALGPYDDLPLPLGLLFDAEGALACLYVGRLDAGEVAGDVARLAAGGAEALTGGRWASRRPTRDLRQTADWLRRSGQRALADEVQAAAAQRAGD